MLAWGKGEPLGSIVETAFLSVRLPSGKGSAQVDFVLWIYDTFIQVLNHAWKSGLEQSAMLTDIRVK